MADATTPEKTPETAPAAPAAPVSLPYAKYPVQIDARIKDLRAEIEQLTKLKGTVNATIDVSKQKGLPPAVIARIVSEMMPKAGVRRGRAKGVKSTPTASGGKATGRGRGNALSDAKVKKIEVLHKKGLSNNKIAKRVKTSAVTVGRYVKLLAKK